MGSNFHIPDNPSERSNHIIIIEHIDEMLDILREQPASEEEEPNIIYMIDKTDDLEAIVWQL
ncbi:MAG: hypothetical protein ACKPKO_63645, partial [Candidatus Fonsibacter sp.]